MAYDSKDERSNEDKSVLRKLGVKDGCGYEAGGKAPGGKGGKGMK